MKTIVVASHNENKIREIGQIIPASQAKVISRDQAGVPPFEIEEDGTTFEENSFKKANEIMKRCGMITIADDSGLVVDCLGGAPGVYSARYAGEQCDDKANNRKLAEMIRNFPFEERTGRFVSVITMVFPDGRSISARGEVDGHIIPDEIGENGFGYDPMFIPLGYDITFGQFDPEAKNRISHRGNALRKLSSILSRGGYL